MNLAPDFFDRYIASCAESIRLALTLRADEATQEDVRNHTLEIIEESIANVYEVHLGVQREVARSFALGLVTRLVEVARANPDVRLLFDA